jgi:hypothetical protein
MFSTKNLVLLLMIFFFFADLNGSSGSIVDLKPKGSGFESQIRQGIVGNTTRGCRLWKVKNSGYKNSSPTEAHLHSFVNFYNKKFVKFLSSQIQRTYISVLKLFHIKFMFISFSLCCNHFTSLAYEIFISQKSGLIWQDKRSCFIPKFPKCVLVCLNFDNFWKKKWFFLDLKKNCNHTNKKLFDLSLISAPVTHYSAFIQKDKV